MHISDLPPELHTHIVELACTEIPSSSELSSARALSRVSPYWYSVARPFRYHAIRIAGPRNIARLLSTFEGLSEREKRTMLVRHLSLSDTLSPASPNSPSNSDSEIEMETEKEEVALDNNNESLIRTKSNIARLLTLLIPSLYSFELHLASLAYSTSLIAMLWELPAPFLVSLSVKGYYPFPNAPLCLGLPFRSSSSSSFEGKEFGQVIVAATSSSLSNSNFPRLEHLSLDGVSNPSGLLSLGSLGCVFPRLETLEIRGLRGALAFAHEVVDAVRERDVTRSRSRGNKTSKETIVGDANLVEKQVADHNWFALRSSRPLPKTLRRLSLFLAQEPSGRVSKRGNALHKKMLKVLMSVASRDVPGPADGCLQVFVEDWDSDFPSESVESV